VGQIVFPVFRAPMPAEKPRTTGEFLAAELAVLERIAATNGIPPLTAFADPRPVPDDFDGPPSEQNDLLGPCDAWFAAADGREALTRLAHLIRERPELAGGLESPDNVAEELDDLAHILAVAAEAGVEFRLDMR
jgi:hypothetical protein